MGYFSELAIDTRTCGQAAEDAWLDRRDGYSRYGQPITGVIHTGYAVITEQHGYVCVSRDFFTHGWTYLPNSNQSSPSLDFTHEDASKKVDWLNTHFAGIGASVKPLRYRDGEWIDQP